MNSGTLLHTPRNAGFLASGRTSMGHVFFGLCMAAVAGSFLLFYVLFKYKVVLFGWAICLGLFAAFWIGRAARLRLSLRVLWPLLAFQGWLWLTTLWSYDPARSVWWLALDMLLPALFLLSIAWAQNVSAWRLSWYFELTALLYAALGLWFLLTTGNFIDDRFGAVRSGMAVGLLCSLPFLLWRLRLRPNPYRASLVIWSIVALLGIGSRAALVLLPLALAAAGAIAIRTTRRPLTATFLAVMVAIVATAGILAVPGVRAGLAGGLARFSPQHRSFNISAAVVQELGRSDAVDIDRRLQAYVALETFLAHPVLGDGYMNTYLKIVDRFHREISAHGLPFTLLAETGLVGTVLFLLMIGRFYGAVRRAARVDLGPRARGFQLTLQLTFTVLLLFGLFHQVHQNPTFYILLGWGYALAISARPMTDGYHARVGGARAQTA